MITTSKLKRHVWIADDDEFDHIVKNSQRVLKLNNQYTNIHMLKNLQKIIMLCLYIEHRVGGRC